MLTTGDQLRSRIQDPIRFEIRDLVSDGRSLLFPVPHTNLLSGSAFVLSGSSWVNTGATFMPEGVVALTSGAPFGSSLQVRYYHSVFSDEELGTWITGYGFLGATREAIWALMFDGLKRSRWSSPDGTSYDDTQALRILEQLDRRVDRELQDQAAGAGGFGSWSENQQDWGPSNGVPDVLW